MPESLEQRRIPSSRHRLNRLARPAAVHAGGLLGSGLRAAVAAVVPATANGFPAATLIVNLAGSLMVGAYLARRERAVVAGWSLHFWAIGALGSFTTFSAFGLEVFRLIDIGRRAAAAGYAVASTLGGLATALLGQRIGGVGR